jgi:hypothetical protein
MSERIRGVSVPYSNFSPGMLEAEWPVPAFKIHSKYFINLTNIVVSLSYKFALALLFHSKQFFSAFQVHY